MTTLDRDRGMQHANALACCTLVLSDAAGVRGAMAYCRSSVSIGLADPGASSADLPLDRLSR